MTNPAITKKIDKSNMKLELPKFQEETAKLVKESNWKVEVRKLHGLQGYVFMAGDKLPESFIREDYRHAEGEYYKAFICDRRPLDSAEFLGVLESGRALYRYHQEPEAGPAEKLICPEGTLFIERENYLDRSQLVSDYREDKRSQLEFLKQALNGESNLKTMGGFEVGQRVNVARSRLVTKLQLKAGAVEEKSCAVEKSSTMVVLSFSEKRNSMMVRYVFQPQVVDGRLNSESCVTGSIMEIPFKK